MVPQQTEPSSDPPIAFRPQPRRLQMQDSLPAEFSPPAPAPQAVPADESTAPPAAPPPVPLPTLPDAPRRKPSRRSSCLGSLMRSLMWVVVLSCLGALWFYLRTTPQDNYDSGMQFVAKGDYTAAFPLLHEAATAGLSAAYFPLAGCYAEGRGTKADAEQARHWYTLAEQGGSAAATLALAEMDFAAEDYAAAAARYTKGAGPTTARQLYQCALCYHRQVPAAPPTAAAGLMQQAVHFYNLAAEQGHTAAAIELGTCHYKGIGTPSSRAEAIRFFTQAAEQGHADAQFRLAWCLFEEDAAQDTAALQWLTRAAEQGNIPACYDLAVCYLTGRGTHTDPAQAFSWLKKAADAQHPAALRRLAFCYRDGAGTPKNIPLSLQCFAAAAAAGDAEAQFNYAWCLHHGYGLQQDLPAAVSLYARAASQRFAPAQEALRSLLFCRLLPKNLLPLLEKSQNYPKM